MDGERRSKQRAPDPAGGPGPGWLPAQVRREADELMLDWAWFGRQRLTEPFYEQSLAKVAGGARRRVSTPLAALAGQPVPPDGLGPSGLIFHMSRCGSTLVSQMLAASEGNIVVSEAPPIDGVVRSQLPEADRVALLRGMARALGQVRNPGEARLFIKLDSWHACALPLFRAAFPATPWVFLYREPSAVMVSHVRRVGMQMVSELVSPAFYGLGEDGRTWGEDYFAQVLGAICAAAAQGYAGGGGLLVNYDELPGALLTQIQPHFGVTPTQPEVEAMARTARFDAKAPGAPFTPDVEAKRIAATSGIDAAVQRHLAGVYARLEALRRPA
jgi:hypothetical protein